MDDSVDAVKNLFGNRATSHHFSCEVNQIIVNNPYLKYFTTITWSWAELNLKDMMIIGQAK